MAAQGNPDTLKVAAADVISLRSSAPIFAPVHSLDAAALGGPGAVDLEAGLNQIPGVKMETRGAGGSRRLRMRGSSLRSPFGVRNVFTILDGFVLTTADGDSPLEWFDPALLHQVDVMTGPSGAALGGSYSGALWAVTRASGTHFQVRTATLGTGAAGDGNFSSVISAHAQSGLWNASIIRASQPGYRDQEANGKLHGDLHWRSVSAIGRAQHFWCGLFDGRWELPGSVDLETAQNSPTAAPGAPFSAQVDRRRIALGWSSTRALHSDDGIWATFHVTDKKNPYGTSPFYNGDKSETGLGTSIRWARGGSLHENEARRWSWRVQGIFQADRTRILELDGVENAFKYDVESTTARGWAGGSVRRVNARGVALHLGAAWNAVERQTNGTVATADSIFAEQFQSLYPSPRAGIQIPVGEHDNLFAELGSGINIPTAFELLDPETLAAYQLKPEKGATAEAGWRSNRGSLLWEVSAFHQQVRNAIGLQPGPTDALVLGNENRLIMNGLEAHLDCKTSFQSTQWTFRFWATLNRFWVETTGWIPSYRMPGTALHTAGAMVHGQLHSLHWDIRHRWNDRAPLNDAATDWAPAHHRIDLSLAWKKPRYEVQLAALNASNSRYSDWYQINAFGGKYFNPIAPRRLELTVTWWPTRLR